MTAGVLNWHLTGAEADSPSNVVLIVLDGARPDYFNVSGIPNVKRLIQKGTQYSNAFAGILEAETPSAHVTIATGSEPWKTGIPSFWWATDRNVAVSLFNPTKIRAGDMEKIVRQSGAPTLAGRLHAKQPRAAVVALSGSKYYAADAIGGPDANVTMYFQSDGKGKFVPTYIPGHTPPAGILNSPDLAARTSQMPLGVQNNLAMKLAAKTFTHMRQQVTLINLPEFDWPLGHVDGATLYPHGVQTLMQAFDRDLAMLQETYRKAGALDRTLFVLMADHGMMPLTHTIPQSEILAAVSKAGTRVISGAYTSGVYLWLKDEKRAPQVAQNIAALGSSLVQSVYVRGWTGKSYAYRRFSSSKLLRSGGTEVANQYLLNSFNGSNAPDVVISFAEGVGCEPGGQAKWKADHGGPSWQSQHLPLILSGPGIRAGYSSSFPARLIDVAPTVLNLLGASSAGMHGVPLADAMTHAPAWAAQSQKSVSKQLIPVVAALQGQSHFELAARR